MYKFLILICIICCFKLTVQADTLIGGIVYNVENARKLSFENTRMSINMDKYSKYMKDKNYCKNRKLLLKEKFNISYTDLTKFSDGGYSIRYKKLVNPCFYYDKNGKLVSMGFMYGDVYPKKYIMYDAKGHLDSVSLVISANEQYMFDKNKEMQFHWIKENCYNKKGELVKMRK